MIYTCRCKDFQFKHDKINSKNPIQIIQNNTQHFLTETTLQQQLLDLIIHAIFPDHKQNSRTFPNLLNSRTFLDFS